MAQIIVTSDPPSLPRVVYRERVEAEELASAHFSRHLVQRLAWAAEDAAAHEAPARPVHGWTPSEP